MSEAQLITIQVAILILLLIACLAAITFKRLHFPYTVGLIIIGSILELLSRQFAVLEPLQALTLSHGLILFLFLPPLIFESALSMNFRVLVRNLGPVILLAGPGLILSMMIVGWFLSRLTPLELPQALLFGAMISATDPVAVIALFKEFGVSQRLMTLVEGESLFNDATAIVTFEIILTTAASGVFGIGTLGMGLVNILLTLIGGVVVGVVLAASMAYAIPLAKNNPLIQGTISAIVAYVAFIIAEQGLQVSGVIAVMSAGLIAGWLSTNRMVPETREFLQEFWEYAAFLANSLIFLLIGLNITRFGGQLMATGTLWWSLLWAIAAALIARAATVYLLIPVANLVQRSDPVDWRCQTVSFWGGVRGAVALALALSLDPSFPNHDLIMTLTLGVVLFTIITGGLTMKKVLHWLKLDQPPLLERLEWAQAQVVAKRQGLQQIINLVTIPSVSQRVINALQEEYEQALKQAEQAIASFWSDLSAQPTLARRALWLQALAIEQKTIQTLHDQGLIAETTLDRLNLTVNLKRDAILCDRIPPPQQAALPLETRLEQLMASVVARLVPQSGIVQQQREEILKTDYEYNAALAIVGEEVAHNIHQLAEDHGIEALIAQECAQVYERLSTIATERLNERNARGSEIAIALQEKMARQVALLGEEEAIAQLTAEGAISTTVASKICHQIEAGRDQRLLKSR